jgi:hypothetical protein
MKFASSAASARNHRVAADGLAWSVAVTVSH